MSDMETLNELTGAMASHMELARKASSWEAAPSWSSLASVVIPTVLRMESRALRRVALPGHAGCGMAEILLQGLMDGSSPFNPGASGLGTYCRKFLREAAASLAKGERDRRAGMREYMAWRWETHLSSRECG
jgi:hypothetical protein